VSAPCGWPDRNGTASATRLPWVCVSAAAGAVPWPLATRRSASRARPPMPAKGPSKVEGQERGLRRHRLAGQGLHHSRRISSWSNAAGRRSPGSRGCNRGGHARAQGQILAQLEVTGIRGKMEAHRRQVRVGPADAPAREAEISRGSGASQARSGERRRQITLASRPARPRRTSRRALAITRVFNRMSQQAACILAKSRRKEKDLRAALVGPTCG